MLKKKLVKMMDKEAFSVPFSVQVALTTAYRFFSTSMYENSNVSIELQPLFYQDDVLIMCLDPLSAQLGNNLIDNVM